MTPQAARSRLPHTTTRNSRSSIGVCFDRRRGGNRIIAMLQAYVFPGVIPSLPLK